MRIAVTVLRQEPHAVQELAHAGSSPRGVWHDAVNGQWLRDDLPHRHARIQRAVRVLENHLDLAADRAQLRLVEGREVTALEDDAAVGRPLELEDAAPRRRLPAPRLADQAERLAAVERERHAVDRAHDPPGPTEQSAADGEVLDEVLDLEEDVAHPRVA